ncbi:unnamed protein product [Pleuronectes platessa]|uniref:Uncharacterized protein n=1 Tax=Pleuronectes platessa TaxID=8262 RepID=A0A9N7VZF5_PLEPL|nr:unnamed protein product [Pleuronectes platessa]
MSRTFSFWILTSAPVNILWIVYQAAARRNSAETAFPPSQQGYHKKSNALSVAHRRGSRTTGPSECRFLRRPLPLRASSCFVSFGPRAASLRQQPPDRQHVEETNTNSYLQSKADKQLDTSFKELHVRTPEESRAEQRRTISSGYTHILERRQKTGSSDT